LERNLVGKLRWVQLTANFEAFIYMLKSLQYKNGAILTVELRRKQTAQQEK